MAQSFKLGTASSGLFKIDWGKNLIVIIPVLWLILFFLLPFLIVFKISFSEVIRAQPPYSAVFVWKEGSWLPSFEGSLYNYKFLLADSLYLNAYLSSLGYATVATLLTLIVGYPLAYTMARSSTKVQNILLFLIVLPFWTSFLLRVYAWQGFLNSNGFINSSLLWLGIVDEPLTLLRTKFAVYSGLLYSYLPFMVLPLFATLSRMDWELLEAAEDMGARRWQRFFDLTLPLSLSGIIAGSMLVFIPIIGEFIIPKILGGAEILMIGQVLWDEYFRNRDWPMASAVAIIMLALVILPLILLQQNLDTGSKPARSKKLQLASGEAGHA